MPKWYGGGALNPDGLVPAHEQWRDQWSRVQRWARRVRGLKRKAEFSELSPEDVDTVLAFFHNAYALRDWIRVCRPDVTSKLNDLFATSFEMGALRDLCNGFKHKVLERPSHDADFNLYREVDPFQSEIDSLRSEIRYRVAFADGDDIRRYDLFEYAEECVRHWGRFVNAECLDSAGGEA
jgi:hypothetical protein